MSEAAVSAASQAPSHRVRLDQISHRFAVGERRDRTIELSADSLILVSRPRAKVLAHQSAHGFIPKDGAILGCRVPRSRFGAVGDVSKSFIERLRSRVVLLDAQLGPVQPSVGDPLLCCADEESADPTRLHHRMNF